MFLFTITENNALKTREPLLFIAFYVRNRTFETYFELFVMYQLDKLAEITVTTITVTILIIL